MGSYTSKPPASEWQQRQNSPLLQLPAELRNQIWQLAVQSPGRINIATPREQHEAGIMRVCRQARAETTAMYYRNNIFLLDISNPRWYGRAQLTPLFAWLYHAGPSNCALIRSIAITSPSGPGNGSLVMACIACHDLTHTIPIASLCFAVREPHGSIGHIHQLPEWAYAAFRVGSLARVEGWTIAEAQGISEATMGIRMARKGHWAILLGQIAISGFKMVAITVLSMLASGLWKMKLCLSVLEAAVVTLLCLVADELIVTHKVDTLANASGFDVDLILGIAMIVTSTAALGIVFVLWQWWVSNIEVVIDPFIVRRDQRLHLSEGRYRTRGYWRMATRLPVDIFHWVAR